MIEVIVGNNGKKIKVAQGTTLKEVAEKFHKDFPFPVLGALVNNKLKELSFKIFEPQTIKFIDITSQNGKRLYLRALSFVFYKAVKDLYPGGRVRIEHSVSKGPYCEIGGIGSVTQTKIEKIRKKMQALIKADLPFEREKILTAEAVKLFTDNNLPEKALLFKTRKKIYTSVYKLGDTVNYFFGYLVPSTAYLKVFDLVKYNEGILIVLPSKKDPLKLEDVIKQDKLFHIFREHKKWIKILEVPYVGDLNEAISGSRIANLIKVAEALHEKKIATIADKIYRRRENIKLVLVSGPSSSGKTTFSKRLSVQLRVLGIKSFQLSLDDFFLNREQTPLDESGDYNFETIDAIDVDLFNKVLIDLLSGRGVYMPKFDFASGRKKNSKFQTFLPENTLIIVEGIHGLNPKLTEKIIDIHKFQIFVSALTQISIDAQNPIPSTDNRLIRRIVRDYQFRGYSALDTMKRWASVKKGEEKYIFPFQERADVIFNSALLYELAILKPLADPIIREVPENDEKFAEAIRLLKFLSYFFPVQSKHIPHNSIIREFLGGSSFKY